MKCQKVYCTVDLILFDELKQSTELEFQKSLYRAIDDGALTFPEESGVDFVGPPRSSVVVIPEITEPLPDDGGESSNWQVPVSIACSVLGVLVLGSLIGLHVMRRRHKIETSFSQQSPRSLEGDLEDAMPMDAEMYSQQSKDAGSYRLDVEQGGENSKMMVSSGDKLGANPFLMGDQSEASSSSGSSSSSTMSDSESSSNSEASSSAEDIDNRGPSTG